MTPRVPELAVALAKEFEGFHREVRRQDGISAVPYLCPAGFWTIGYGHLCGKDHPPVTHAQAEEFLAADLQSAFSATLRFCPILALEPQARLAAIVDFTFNLGAGRLQTSTLRRRINEGEWEEAGTELMRWVHAGGRVLSGLVRRREAERRMLLGVA